MIRRISSFVATVAAAILLAAPVLAGTYKTITIDDLYDDWAGVPVVDSDAGDNFNGPDIGDTRIANDGQYLYIRNTFPNSLQLSTYIAIDTDQNPATGFDILGLGILGSEAGWQNDFGFSQATGEYNSGPLIGEDFFGAGHALLAPFGNFAERELAISLANMNNGGFPTFPGSTIRLIIYADTGTGADGIPFGLPGDAGLNGDVSAIIEYTLAVPEPASLPGDYNSNNIVDAADYTVWRDSLGQAGTDLAADGTGPGGMPDNVVDSLDYDFWKAHFGMTADSGSFASTNAAIPEPSTFALLMFAVATSRLRRGRAA